MCDGSFREKRGDGVAVQPGFDPSCLFGMYVRCLFLVFIFIILLYIDALMYLYHFIIRSV